MHSISEIGTNVPAFLGKLWKMVEDPLTNDLISWCSLGDSFVIKDATRLARELLPMYYKHNNMASFIRQLNMYGFHKIVSSDCKQDVTEMKFTHPHFIRGHPYLLEKIKRKVGDITVTRGPEKPTIMNKMLNDVKQMKGKQDSLDSRLITMKRENEALWRELSHMRQKHKKQQHIVNKLIQYLVILIQTNHLPVTRRGFPLMLRDKAGHNSSVDQNTNSPTGPVIHELESADVLLEDVDSSIAPTVSSSDTSSDVFSPDVDIEGDILTTNDIEVMKDEFPEDFLTVADKTIPVDIQNLTSLSNDQEDVIVNVPNVTAKIQPKTKKRLNRSVIKTQAKKQKKESTPLHFVVTNTDNGNFVVVPNDIYIPPENETLPPVTNVNDGSPLEVTLSPGIVTQDWTTSSPTTVLNPTKDTLISTPIVEDILSPVTAETVLPNPISTEPSVDILPCGISDLELNNMQVARVDSGKNGNYINRFGRLEDIDSHLGSVQADLDSFKELLKNEGISLDANALLGFLNEESMPLISNSGEDYMNSFSKQKDLEGNELIMYNPSIFDLSDITSEPDEWILPDTNDTELSLQDDVFKEVGLNTPQFAMNNPSFPTSAKTTKT